MAGTGRNVCLSLFQSICFLILQLFTADDHILHSGLLTNNAPGTKDGRQDLCRPLINHILVDHMLIDHRQPAVDPQGKELLHGKLLHFPDV